MSSRGAVALWVFSLAGCGTSIVLEDAGPPAEATVDPVGTWHDCSTTVIYGPDGSTTAINHREGGCTARGSYTVVGDIVTTTWTEPGCGFGPEPSPHRVVRGERGIASINPATAQVNKRANGELTPHTIYRVVGTEMGLPDMTSVLSVVGDPSDNEFADGCYWSEDGVCGGLFSCSGDVAQWRFEEDRLIGSVTCMGGCPCGAVVSGTRAADGTITGEYQGVNCDRTYEGTFVATPL